jgi:hypothetical protein
MVHENPSIGMVGSIVYDKHNRRAKGILTGNFSHGPDLTKELRAQFEKLPKNPGDISRVTARSFVGDMLGSEFVRAIKDPSLSSPVPLEVDAVIHIPKNDMGIVALIYIGGNSPERTRSSEIVDENRKIINIAKKLSEIPPEPLPNGYSQQLVIEGKGLSEQDYGDITRIYESVFESYVMDLDYNTIRANIEKNAIGVVRNLKGKIISLTVSEIVPKIIDGITLVELTDSATDPEWHLENHDVKNVNHWAREILLEYIRNTSSGITVVYSEARADLVPVVRNNFWSGFSEAGILPNSCQMSSNITSSVYDRGPYGDLVVMYNIIKK